MIVLPGDWSVPASPRGFTPRLIASSSTTRILSQSLGLLCSLLFGALTVHAQKLDMNGNGISDVWEWKYNATGVATNVDSDGDGVPNFLEALAGTDPFDSNS